MVLCGYRLLRPHLAGHLHGGTQPACRSAGPHPPRHRRIPPRTSLVPGERSFTSLSIMTEQTHSRLRALSDADHFPALSPEYLHAQPAFGLGPLDPAPRILLLYGSLRERSYSRLVVEERSEEHTSELQSLMRSSYA